ncbi:MAG: aldehyde dehydrogenase family protein [Phycisphaeraceae bacterium]|nr:aldehyde dehydrogenase family protein [Phycisphaerales bacterium]MCB9841792.1 aldehyde dehydrogenase family protein [Phycisphaeraceae bacterium]
MNNAKQVLDRLSLFDDPRVVAAGKADDGCVVTENPATGEPIAAVRLDSLADYERAIGRAESAQRQWRTVPGPVRGEIVRRIGNALREKKDELGSLVTLEMGKIKPEGDGEVQECIDIADFAVGLSRQLGGPTLPSERQDHRLMEQWHPLGTVGVITAFNFPIAVWAWNAMLAAVCGDAVLWKPSLMTPLVAVAANRVAQDVMRGQDLFKPAGGAKAEDIFTLVIGRDQEIGEAMTGDRRLPLISATGSCRMGRIVGQKVAARLGRCLLELGGNNAITLMPDADMELAMRAVVFGAVGTAGQRCTSTRRLLCVGGCADTIVPKLVSAYKTVTIGDPLKEGTLMGPLINEASVKQMRSAIESAVGEGCKVLVGGVEGIDRRAKDAGHFVEPTIIRVPKGKTPKITCEETFAPILYVFEVDTLDDAIAMQNGVDQGLSSAIFTDSVRAAERFLSPAGSDCGIANVNLGTSGAEIGGAFGGEKDTGGGRESGSDSWKAYMRRQTCTINYGTDLPLAQGIRFG